MGAVPLYFANDIFIGMIGYERAEVERDFAQNTAALFLLDGSGYSADSTHLQELGDDLFLRCRRLKKGGGFLWAAVRMRGSKDNEGRPVLLSVITDITELVNLQNETQAQNRTILASLDYAARRQRDLLPPRRAFARFADSAVLWPPKDVVGGDIYWLKHFEAGSVLAVCGCTGHGVPGASAL